MSRTLTSTFSAMSLSSLGVKIKIGRFIRMALWAMSFNSLLASQPESLFASLGIHASSDDLKVAGSTTGREHTQMVRFQSFGNWAKFSFIKKSMDQFVLALKTYSAIASSIEGASEYPARPKFWGMIRNRAILIDLSPDILKGISWRHGDMIPHYDW